MSTVEAPIDALSLAAAGVAALATQGTRLLQVFRGWKGGTL